MKQPQLDIVILGLSITSSWGNGHATTYRCLVRGLVERGHKVLFLERDVPWYAENRDMRVPPYGSTELYSSLRELRERFTDAVRRADLVIVGSYVPEGAAIGEWVTSTADGITAFYDIDTPVTIARLERGETDYITRSLIPKYELYLSFTGGPTLQRLEHYFGAVRPRVLYCSVDPEQYYPEANPERWLMGYLGTYSEDRQGMLNRLLIEPARMAPQNRFAVAGPLYPENIEWPPNVERIQHLAPGEHRTFYNSQRFTLNVTRAEMVCAGYSPSVRLFEAAACGTPIISDYWSGLEEIFVPGTEILISHTPNETLSCIHDMPEERRHRIAENARRVVLERHTGRHRAADLEKYFMEAFTSSPRRLSREGKKMKRGTTL